jgi:hypothetical protein
MSSFSDLTRVQTCCREGMCFVFIAKYIQIPLPRALVESTVESTVESRVESTVESTFESTIEPMVAQELGSQHFSTL